MPSGTTRTPRVRAHGRLARNAAANVARGGVTALAALLLPPILVRHMDAAAYAAWALVLQTAGYVAYLDFGLQTAVGRSVACAEEKKNDEQRDAVFSTALAGLTGAALLALALLAVAVWATPRIFPQVPAELLPGMRWALLLVGGSVAAGLPASAWIGVWVGLQRYEFPALATGGTRALAAAGLAAAALAGQSLRCMAAIVAAGNLLSYAALYLGLRRVAPGLRFQRPKVSGATARVLARDCFSLNILLLATLLIAGCDLLLVARFDFGSVAAYSLAASPIVFLAGLLYAVLGVLTPHAARLHAREDAAGLGELTLAATRVSVLLLLLTGLPLFIYAAPLLRLWVGGRFVESARPLLLVLVAGNLIRLTGAAYATIVIAAGEQRAICLSPLAEGLSNFAASVVLGFRYGAIGVALGTLLGAVVGVGAHLLISMPRTRRVIALRRSRFLLSGVLLPGLGAAPLLVLAAATLAGTKIGALWFGAAWMVSLGGLSRMVGRALGTGPRPADAAGVHP